MNDFILKERSNWKPAQNIKHESEDKGVAREMGNEHMN